jgi:predicted transcriptional regulator of viral defense system
MRDLQAILPEKNSTSFRALIGRAEKNGLLKRVCRGLYLYPKVDFPAGLILYHAAARLRANEFNYISLETALSDAGVISQIPMNWITLMSSGRSYTFNCGSFGHIEFVHTKKKLDKVATQVTYDPLCRLWRASASLALRDMALTRRNTDLIDWEIANELI